VRGSETFKGLVVLMITAVLWSTSGIGIKLVSWHPVGIAGARSAVAAVMLAIISRSIHPPRNVYGYLASCSYAATMITFVIANKLTTSANAIFLQYLFPAFVALLAIAILKEFPHTSDWLILSGLFVGMAIFFLDRLGLGGMIGNFVAIVSGLCMALFIVLMKKDVQSDAVGIMLYGHIFCALLAIPFIPGAGLPDLQSILGIAYLGIVQIGVTSLLFAYAVRRLTALTTAVVSLIEPVINPVWVFLLIRETPSTYALIGGSIIVGLVGLRSVIALRRERAVLISTPGNGKKEVR
jgi:drug/metabolite transporter (DMT)-like permease